MLEIEIFKTAIKKIKDIEFGHEFVLLENISFKIGLISDLSIYFSI
jgi:hypothetical protein